ncbi:MAG: NifU family protein [Rickettsiaceae bacterium]|nr:NifU family protein [Rickettsiaceae bacterium]
MFIQTESTPNPNALKFFPGQDVASEPIHFDSKENACGVKLVSALFNINDVEAVFFGSDFITITKTESAKWDILKPFIISEMMSHFSANLPALEGHREKKKDHSLSDLTEIENQIIEIIETRVRPSVAMDGGDITYKGFEDGVVYLELKGSCAGCPSSSVTLKNGIESMLQYYIPEVKSVEAIE